MTERSGAGYILEAFKEAEDTLDGIATVQQDNKVRISSMQPAIPMLDLHGMTRADIHASLFKTMQDKLLLKVGSLENRGLTKLLDRCFRYIGAEQELQAVCLRIMEKLPTVDSKYLSHIAENHDLYSACPLEVKRQIWQGNHGLFGEAVSPLLDQYVAEKEAILSFASAREAGMSSDGKLSSFLSLLPKTRRQSTIVQDLVGVVGTSQALYATLLQFLRTLYLRTQISHYCTLRADVLMKLHDTESPICSSDRCYKFAWCLDACIRVGHVDGKKGRELYSFLEGIVGGDEILA
jgi:negative elongation factor B